MSPIWHDPDEPIAAAYVRSSGVKRSCRLRARNDVNDPTRKWFKSGALYAAGVFLLRSLVWNVATLGIAMVLLSLV
jgi:hypothetical protein